MKVWVVITDTDNGVDVAAFHSQGAAEEHERKLKDEILNLDRASGWHGDVPADALAAEEDDYFGRQGVYFTVMQVEVQ